MGYRANRDLGFRTQTFKLQKLAFRSGAMMWWLWASCGSFRKLGVPYFGVLIIRILLFGVLYQGPLVSETPIWSIAKAD